jgi:hypothetical protein
MKLLLMQLSLHPAVTSFALRFEYSLTADADFVCDAARGTAAVLGDVRGMLCTSNNGLQDTMYCIDRHEEFLKFITSFEMNFRLLLACNRNLCNG